MLVLFFCCKDPNTTKTVFIFNFQAVILVGWILAAGSALAVIYGPYPYVKDMELLPNDLSALYNALSRPVFVTAVAWVVIVCAAGYGGN